MSIKSDAEEFKKNEKKLEAHEGNPKGTHFVVIALLICLVFVGIYFVAIQTDETEKSPTISRPAPVTNPALSR